MIESGVYTPENIRTAVELAPLVVPFLMAFTKKQRDAIVFGRDKGECQHPTYYENGRFNCGSNKDLELHHIAPQRWEEQVLHKPEHQRDIPENAITLCKAHHHYIHPDVNEALIDYGKKKKNGEEKPDSFKLMAKKRNEAVENKEKYWETEYDEAYREIARDRTDHARTRGWIFPRRRKK